MSMSRDTWWPESCPYWVNSGTWLRIVGRPTTKRKKTYLCHTDTGGYDRSSIKIEPKLLRNENAWPLMHLPMSCCHVMLSWHWHSLADGLIHTHTDGADFIPSTADMKGTKHITVRETFWNTPLLFPISTLRFPPGITSHLKCYCKSEWIQYGESCLPHKHML